jgi:hypothetical protein
MWGQIDYQTAKNRQADFLREAEERRRVKAVEAARRAGERASRSGSPAAPVFHAVGRSLVAVGSRLMAL